ncbi:hypothetical protein DFJ58DRAFT_717148 [Suillus subalutaceus]|uniref:uncharacterized protein n=1 Tax=Suillus subalutaceus TaxID=48586 RepID=UPI001B8754A7|nr:uncharacterized protein DFJ58DRAFT_717148 [Suillus subalutaceus]KAG1847645.1 hypothetical protein DFJ58DRAFT_717148 [Suillus subalutaceus]
MRAFIKCLLRFKGKGTDLHEGILGAVSTYYGCVEAQGRGTLHCHMLIWLKGGLNPNEIKDSNITKKMYQYRNQTFHPCSTRGKDAHFLAKKCRIHRHSKMCWKYWRGPPELKECCFDLDEKNIHPISLTDPDTGEITLKCLDSLVNHFNASILEAMRLQYGYKVHRFRAGCESDTMLQKCAHSMISHQELSAQQVCSYLMDFEDHFTSPEYRGLYWTNFESFVEKTTHNYDDDTKGNLDGHDEELEDRPVEGTLDDDGVYVEQLQNDEIRISSDKFGNHVPKAVQLMDYLHQDEKFNNISV